MRSMILFPKQTSGPSFLLKKSCMPSGTSESTPGPPPPLPQPISSQLQARTPRNPRLSGASTPDLPREPRPVNNHGSEFERNDLFAPCCKKRLQNPSSSMEPLQEDTGESMDGAFHKTLPPRPFLSRPEEQATTQLCL